MEITGNIKTTIDLIKLLKHVVDFIRQITSHIKMDEVAQEIKAQLSNVKEFLRDVKQRQAHLPNIDHGPALQGFIQDIEGQINGVQKILDNLEASHKGHSRVLKRGRLVLGGFDKDLRSREEKLGRLKQSLETHIKGSEARYHAFSQNFNKLQARFRFCLPDLKDRRLKGTLEWIWKDPLFNHWLATPLMQDSHSTHSALSTNQDTNLEERVLIFSGVMGCGKSVLAVYVANELRKQHRALFFAFSTDRKDQRDTGALLRSLLIQIFRILPSERQRHHILGFLDEAKPINDPDDLIGKVAELAKEVDSDLYVIIDGIDESVDDWNQPSPGPLDHIETLLKANAQIRLLLLGKQSSLRGALARWSCQIELTSKLMKTDIESFIASELKTCHNIEGNRRGEVQEALESRSTNPYLWLQCIFVDLRRAGSPREIKKALNRRPDELNALYSRMLSNIMIKDKGELIKKRSKELFTLIVGASRPLTMTELLRAHAFALPLTQQASGHQANLLQRESVVEACGDFITVEDDVVQLVHTSMREFFLRESHLWKIVDEHDIEFFRLELQDCHRMLGVSCLTYMKCVDWQTQALSDPMDESINDNKFFDYASHYLFSHLLGSNLTLQDESLQFFEFVNSSNGSAWVDMILNQEDESSRQLPIKFWDDACHFLGAWGYSDAKFKRALRSICDVKQGSTFGPPAQYQGSERPRESFLRQIVEFFDDNGSGAYGSDFDQEAAPEGKRKGRRLAGTHSLATDAHRLTSHAQDNLSHMLNSLPLGSSVGPLLQMRDTLIANPIDAVTEALANSTRQMSFFKLMNIGMYIHNVLCRIQQASTFFQRALQKVITERDTRTAWARVWLGHTSSGKDAEAHYREAMDILGGRHMNPLQEFLRYVATIGVIQSILEYGDRSDLGDLPNQFSQQIHAVGCIADSDPRAGSHSGFLRAQCYKVIRSTAFFQKKKINRILSTAEVYEDESLYRDLDELLGPFVDGTVSTSNINIRSFSKLLSLWINAKVMLGETDVAMEALDCAKKRVSKKFLDVVRFQLARLFYNTGRFELARNELSKMKLSEWFRNCTSNDAETTMDSFLGTYARLNQPKKVFQFLNEMVLAQGHIQDAGWFSTVVGLLLAHGLFSNSEELILKTMSQIPARLQLDNTGKLNLYEALAFSARLQNGHKAITASYNYYKNCVKFAEDKLPDIVLTRILIGMGAACVAASKREEASAIFKKLADSNLCASNIFKDFFLAIAYQQDGKSNESHRLFSEVVDTLCRNGGLSNDDRERESINDNTDVEDETPLASDVDLDEEETILLITAYMCLANTSDTNADPKGADRYRRRALKALQNEFASSLDPKICPGTEDVTRWTSRWVRSCQGYLNGSFDDGEGSKDLPKMFPFEVWWSPDVGNDYFKYYRLQCLDQSPFSLDDLQALKHLTCA